MSQESLDRARDAHRRGDLAAALDGYEAVLKQEPASAEVWHLKAVAQHQAGNLAGAEASVERAIESGGAQAPYLMLKGVLCQDRRDLEGAAAAYEAAARARPGWASAHVELGIVRLDQGRVEQALREFQVAVEADGRNARAWNNLGIALQALGRTDEAMRAFNYTLGLDAEYPAAHYNVARILQQRNEIPRAIEHLRAAVRGRPGHVEAWLLLGDLHRRQRESANALAAYNAAAQAEPTLAAPPLMVAETVAEAGGYAEALAEFRRIAARWPENLKAALGANLLLPQVYASAAEVERVRAQYAQGLEKLHDSADRFRFASVDAALDQMRWTNFYLAYQGRNDRDLQRRFGEFQRRVLAREAPRFFEPRARHGGRERLRVGFLSHFFFNCTAGRYFSSWITRLDRTRFDPYVYYTNEWVADDTRKIAGAAAVFRHLPGRSRREVASQVVADELDVLVYPELGMHPDTFTLAGLRLAPVQCAAWGHPDTPGLPEIDWFISCAEMEPPDAGSHYSERLALLPGLGTRYSVPPGAQAVTRADFGLPEDRTLYLVPQSLFKIHPDNDAIIAQVLRQDARGIAVMFASHHERPTREFATRLAGALSAHGLDLHERVIFLAPFVPHGHYLGLNAVCDVMIDTMHWSGGNTSLDALAMGLPVVTCPGALMRGRQSQAMLRTLAVPELVLPTPDALAAKAVELGRDAELRAGLSRRIMANREQLFERDEPVRALEDFLERAAREGA